MNNADNKVKLQIVEKIKASTNILVAVSKDPSVDELSAALGLTVFLNKLDKHATAIFSGAIPPAITFLDPDKVFENTADSLRDFIIALDKEKADHLRYKVEGDVVKIFITPYRTVITDEDLEFSQGDYNIELVLALGVENQEHLDAALAANGKMLHDVTVATFSVGEQSSQLGSVDWRDTTASSLSEMVASLVDTLKTEKVLLDKQIATALLTGIVSATDRFSNILTSSHVMSTAAQLMAAGADQQLIASKLQESHEINSLPSVSVEKIAASKALSGNIPAEPIKEQPEPSSDILSIPHGADEATELAEPTIPDPVEPMTSAPTPTEPNVISASTTITPENNIINVPTSNMASSVPGVAEEPLLGGTLNATSDQAAEDARRELDDQQNKTILSHSYLSGSDTGQTSLIDGVVGQTEDDKSVDIFSEAPTSTLAPSVDSPPTVSPPSVPAVDFPLPPPLPDFSTLPPTPSTSPDFNTTTPESSVSTLPYPSQSPSSTSVPELTLPPIPQPEPIPAPAPIANDPSQFQIPV